MEVNLSGKEICAIIKACKESGVTLFTTGDVRIEFGEQVSHQIHPVPQVSETDLAKQAEIAGLSEESDRLDAEEQDEFELHVTDPAEYERRLLAGELKEDAS